MADERTKFFNEMSFNSDGIVHTSVGIGHPVWKEYKDKLDWLVGFSPYVSVGLGREPGSAAYTESTDTWGCGWIYPLESLDGACIGHPIAEWSDLATYTPPNPDDFTDWKAEADKAAKAKAEGGVARGGTDHGGIYLRLSYLRGFENFMADIGEGAPELDDLVAIVEDHWFEVAKRWVEAGIDVISFGDDLGLQDRLPMSPDSWRRYIKPSYKRIYQYCREHGLHVHMHTDGYIVDIIPDLIECGVTDLNPQEIVNGIDTLVDLVKGRIAINMDIDRQFITVRGTPEEVDAHIENCIVKLGSPGGGLSMVWGVYPPTPLENIEACVRALDRYATYWADGAA